MSGARGCDRDCHAVALRATEPRGAVWLAVVARHHARAPTWHDDSSVPPFVQRMTGAVVGFGTSASTNMYLPSPISDRGWWFSGALLAAALELQGACAHAPYPRVRTMPHHIFMLRVMPPCTSEPASMNPDQIRDGSAPAQPGREGTSSAGIAARAHAAAASARAARILVVCVVRGTSAR